MPTRAASVSGCLGSSAVSPRCPVSRAGRCRSSTTTWMARRAARRTSRSAYRSPRASDAGADLAFFVPTYTFANAVLGGQLSLSMAWAYGETDVSAQATLTGPRGNTITLHPSDSTTGSSDLYPTAALKWHDGNDNYMAYTMVGVPVGEYDDNALANIGTNHWSIDAGGGYTYFNQKNGREISAVAGLTYNFENPDTDYQNGVDGHIDF